MPNMKGIKLDISGLDLPYQRMVLVTNLHPGTTVPELFKFFRGFDVIDIKRGVDTESGKSTFAFVLLGSTKEVVRAHLELDMEQVRGRAVRIEHAYTGFTITESELSGEQRLSIQNEVPAKAMTDVDGLSYLSNSPVSPHWIGGSHEGLHQQVLQAFGSTEWYKPTILPTNPIPMEPWLRSTIDEPVSDTLYLPGLQDIKLPEQPIMYGSLAASISSSSSAHSHAQADFENPKQRVLVIANLHLSVKVNDLRPFFSGLEIVDFKRSVNHKTGKPAPIGFVLFRTIQQRITAHAENNGRLLFGRPVRLETGHNVTVWNTGFTRPNTNLTLPPTLNTVSSPIHTMNPTIHTTPTKGAATPTSTMKPTTPPAAITTTLNPSATAFTTFTKAPSPVSIQQQQHLEQALSPLDMPRAPSNTPIFPCTPSNRSDLNFTASPPSIQPPSRVFSSPASPLSSASSITSASSACVSFITTGGTRIPSSGYSYKDLETLSYFDAAESNTVEEDIATELYGPWNLAGKDSFDRRYNVITEEEWYRFAVENGVLSVAEVGGEEEDVFEDQSEGESEDDGSEVDEDTEWELEYDAQMWVADD